MKRSPRHGGKPRYATAGAALGAALLVIVVFLLGRFFEARRRPAAHTQPQTSVERAWAFQGGHTDTLVVYIFSNTDPEYIVNLKFFLRWGIREGDGADYIVVLQQDGTEASRHSPSLWSGAILCPALLSFFAPWVPCVQVWIQFDFKHKGPVDLPGSDLRTVFDCYKCAGFACSTAC